ncbi:hypothetical protein D6827_00385, partial [Candidatus Parcubacteria bacterium]
KDLVETYLVGEKYREYFPFLFNDQDVKVMDASVAIEAVGKEFQFSKTEKEMIYSVWQRQDDLPMSQYGLSQAIAGAANAIENSDRHYDLKESAWQTAMIPAERFEAMLAYRRN